MLAAHSEPPSRAAIFWNRIERAKIEKFQRKMQKDKQKLSKRRNCASSLGQVFTEFAHDLNGLLGRLLDSGVFVFGKILQYGNHAQVSKDPEVICCSFASSSLFASREVSQNAESGGGLEVAEDIVRFDPRPFILRRGKGNQVIHGSTGTQLGENSNDIFLDHVVCCRVLIDEGQQGAGFSERPEDIF